METTGHAGDRPVTLGRPEQEESREAVNAACSEARLLYIHVLKVPGCRPPKVLYMQSFDPPMPYLLRSGGSPRKWAEQRGQLHESCKLWEIQLLIAMNHEIS